MAEAKKKRLNPAEARALAQSLMTDKDAARAAREGDLYDDPLAVFGRIADEAGAEQVVQVTTLDDHGAPRKSMPSSAKGGGS